MDRRSLSDENIEDILRHHLRAEVEAIPPTANPWERLRDRLPRQHKKFLGLFDLSLGSAARPALAAVAVLVLVIGVTTWQSFENFGGNSPGVRTVTPEDLERGSGGSSRVGNDAINYEAPQGDLSTVAEDILFIVIEDNDSERRGPVTEGSDELDESYWVLTQTSGAPVPTTYPVATSYPRHTPLPQATGTPAPAQFSGAGRSLQASGANHVQRLCAGRVGLGRSGQPVHIQPRYGSHFIPTGAELGAVGLCDRAGLCARGRVD